MASDTEQNNAKKVPRLNLLGQVYGRLAVIEFVELRADHHSIWRVRCECGTIKTVTASCGCFAREQRVQRTEEKREARAELKAAREDIETDEPDDAPEDTKDTLDTWVTEWLRLQSEDENVITLAKRSIRCKMEKLMNSSRQDRDRLNSVGSENGLADDVGEDL